MSKHCIGIIGTDTDVGKTLFTALFAKLLKNSGKDTLLIKAVQTGCYEKDGTKELIAPDVEKYIEIDSSLQAAICHRFLPACSPHLASEKVGNPISAKSLTADIIQKVDSAQQNICLIEGAGGLMTPINANENFSDVLLLLAKQVKLSLILVVANKLGALNHALLTHDKIQMLNIALLGFVMNETREACLNNSLDNEIRADNITYLQQYFSCDFLGALPYNKLITSHDYNTRMRGYAELSSHIDIQHIFNEI